MMICWVTTLLPAVNDANGAWASSRPRVGRLTIITGSTRTMWSVARRYLDGRELTEGLLNHIEVAIRAFDPCLSCATHALGKMPLVVELVDNTGREVDRLTRDANDY